MLALLSCDADSPAGGSGPDNGNLPLIDELDLRPEGFMEEQLDPSEDIPGIFDYSRIAGASHPRLLMSSKDFVDLKSKLSGDKALDYITLFRINRMVIEQANVFVEDGTRIEMSLDISGTRNTNMSRLALKRLFNCAYAYRITGNKKYLEKVKSDLHQACDLEDWHPSHFLDVAELAFGVAIAYDWCYFGLDYETRTLVRRKLLDCAVLAADGHMFHSLEGNWNQVCTAGVIAAALATYEHNRSQSRKAIEDGIAGNRVCMSKIYSPDGNYAEGYGYWSYGTGYEVSLMQMLEGIFGNMAELEKSEGFGKTAEYMLFMTGPSGKDFSYADGGNDAERAMLPMWWFAANQNNPSLLLNEMKLLDANKYVSITSADARLLPLIPCFIKDFKFDSGNIKEPQKKLWYGKGLVPVAMIRTGWKMDSSDCYVGIKSGACLGHSHMDGGSFVFDALGERWSADYRHPDYAEMEEKLTAVGGSFWAYDQKSLRWDIVKMNSYGHSTLAFLSNDGSIDKLHVTDQITSAIAPIAAVFDSDENALGASLDLTALYRDAAEYVYRTIKLKDKTYLEVTDVIRAKTGLDAKLQWRMLTPAKDLSVNRDGIILRQNGKSMQLEVSASGGNAPVPSSWKSERPANWAERDNWDTGLTYMVAGWESTIPAGNTVTFTTTIKPIL